MLESSQQEQANHPSWVASGVAGEQLGTIPSLIGATAEPLPPIAELQQRFPVQLFLDGAQALQLAFALPREYADAIV